MTYPLFRPIADYAVLVEFGGQISDETHARACAFDAALDHVEIEGMVERVPTYTTVYVGYDALITDYQTMVAALRPLLNSEAVDTSNTTLWDIPTCYDAEFAPDKAEVEDILNLPFDEITRLHAEAEYKVYMYGFAPGYAYLGGVPEAIHIPRKAGPVMGVDTRTVMIAGPQALITTVTLPSGWWRIGRAAKSPLQDDPDRPFLFGVGDRVRFVPVSKDALEAHEAGE